MRAIIAVVVLGGAACASGARVGANVYETVSLSDGSPYTYRLASQCHAFGRGTSSGGVRFGTLTVNMTGDDRMVTIDALNQVNQATPPVDLVHREVLVDEAEGPVKSEDHELSADGHTYLLTLTIGACPDDGP